MIAINVPCREATYDRSRRIQYQSWRHASAVATAGNLVCWVSGV